MLTTLLIVVPLAAALVVWAAPLPRELTGVLAILVMLAETGLWIGALVEFDFPDPALQLSAEREWFEELGVSYHVGFYGFSLWLGLAIVLSLVAMGYGLWAGRDRARVLRADAVPRRLRGRRLRLAGPASSTSSSRRC